MSVYQVEDSAQYRSPLAHSAFGWFAPGSLGGLRPPAAAHYAGSDFPGIRGGWAPAWPLLLVALLPCRIRQQGGQAPSHRWALPKPQRYLAALGLPALPAELATQISPFIPAKGSGRPLAGGRPACLAPALAAPAKPSLTPSARAQQAAEPPLRWVF